MIDEKNKTNFSGEVLAADDAEISRLLKGLKRVTTPPDFNVRVRARIASGRPAETSTVRFPLFARYAAGSIALIAVAALFGYVWLNKSNGVSDQTIAGPGSSVQQPKIDPPSDVGVVTPGKTGDEIIAAASPPVPGNPSRPVVKGTEREVQPVESGNKVSAPSRPDQALKGDNNVYPKGIRPNHVNLPKPTEFNNAPRTRAADVLTILGIGAKFTKGVWRVDSVGTTSTAERIGIKAGDVIEAVNDQPMKGKTTFSGASEASGVFTVKTLQVKRGGQTLKIPLSN